MRSWQEFLAQDFNPQEDFSVWSKGQIDQKLSQLLHNNSNLVGVEPHAPVLVNAMNYVINSGGKRIRATLCYALAEPFNIHPDYLTPIALAIELIHAYSLVHDDLPAMDDDDLRRGIPTCHKQFNEATAILVGDALQALAFEMLTNNDLPAEVQVQLIRLLARASGFQGMIGGQMLDIQQGAITLEAIDKLHQLKTGALISTSIEMSRVVCCHLTAAATKMQWQKCLTGYAQSLGLAFQIYDDILDVISTTEVLGKTSGSDYNSGKTTYPALLGLERSVIRAQHLIDESLACLQKIAPNPYQQLENIANKIIQRRF